MKYCVGIDKKLLGWLPFRQITGNPTMPQYCNWPLRSLVVLVHLEGMTNSVIMAIGFCDKFL
jgi:hypothetical protein